MKDSSNKNTLKPPPKDIVEVNLFGTGSGESIVIHLGLDEWAIVDSCINPFTNEPAALSYLKAIGVDPSSQVKFFLISHWHDDHVKGASIIYENCPNAMLGCSSALGEKEFRVYIGATRKNKTLPSRIREFSDILDIKEKRIENKQPATITLAISRRELLSNMDKSRPFTYKISSASPSDYMVELALKEISPYLPETDGEPKLYASNHPNYSCVVLWLSFGELNILLGADVENNKDPNLGWNVILSSAGYLDGKAKIYKVSHHGSRYSDNPKIWSELITEKPFALLSPFIRGNNTLPKKEDIKRICSKTTDTYCTSEPRFYRPRKRERTVERTINEIGKNRKIIGGKFGHVRLRANPKDLKTDIALFGEAIPLCSLQ